MGKSLSVIISAFPKNNSGRDVMIDAPAHLNDDQLDELSLQSKA